MVMPRFVGVELYFEDLGKAKKFYTNTIGLDVTEEEAERYAKFQGESGFICLERKGSDSYPSREKAVLFFQVPDLQSVIQSVGQDRIVHSGPGWAVMHDPEGHNVVFLELKEH
jgi:predicted enzyme related to lactoylglutathione lyase